MAYLRSLDDQILIHIMEGQNLLLGRLLKCDVVVEDGSVSSQHARLKMANNQLRVVDMGSTNGTRINYSPIHGPGYLLDGDTVEFGNVSFIVDGPELVAPAGVAAKESSMALDLLESSQKLSDTMMNIALPSDSAPLEDDYGVETDLQASDEVEAEEYPHKEEKAAPVEVNSLIYGFVMSLLLLLAGGALLLLHLQRAF